MPDDSEVALEVETAAGDEDLALQIASSLPKKGRIN